MKTWITGGRVIDPRSHIDSKLNVVLEGGKVVANSDNNRLQVFFDAIPPAEVREALKGHGFRWARSEGAWQRQLSGNAIYAARHIAAIRPIDGSDPIKIQPKRKPQEHER